MVIPETKDAIVQKTSDLVREYEQQYNDGLITRGEKYNKVVDTWTECTELVAKEMMKRISAVAARRRRPAARSRSTRST